MPPKRRARRCAGSLATAIEIEFGLADRGLNYVDRKRPVRPLSRSQVGSRAEEARLDLTFHQVRHGFASRAAHGGVPVKALSEIMGHSDSGVTERVYIHLYGREQAEEQFRQGMSG